MDLSDKNNIAATYILNITKFLIFIITRWNCPFFCRYTVQGWKLRTGGHSLLRSWWTYFMV